MMYGSRDDMKKKSKVKGKKSKDGKERDSDTPTRTTAPLYPTTDVSLFKNKTGTSTTSYNSLMGLLLLLIITIFSVFWNVHKLLGCSSNFPRIVAQKMERNRTKVLTCHMNTAQYFYKFLYKETCGLMNYLLNFAELW